MFGLHWDNGKEDGNYYDMTGYILGLNTYPLNSPPTIQWYFIGLYWVRPLSKGCFSSSLHRVQDEKTATSPWRRMQRTIFPCNISLPPSIE